MNEITVMTYGGRDWETLPGDTPRRHVRDGRCTSPYGEGVRAILEVDGHPGDWIAVDGRLFRTRVLYPAPSPFAD